MTNTENTKIDATPQIIVANDFNGYFEGKVREALVRIHHCPYSVIRVSATPYLADAFQFDVKKDDEISLKFYSGLRHGFGRIDWSIVDHVLKTLRGDRAGRIR